MTSHRIVNHPILPADQEFEPVAFFWQGTALTARPGEMIASALFAAGIRVFGHHPKDGAPQGLF
ncbi:MAG: (2Fe-2S)-binding protein, partial [Anaerolineae bacterium]|nr:(2Fe-2S)-binding protein [Anaerolineae bacterium]